MSFLFVQSGLLSIFDLWSIMFLIRSLLCTLPKGSVGNLLRFETRFFFHIFQCLFIWFRLKGKVLTKGKESSNSDSLDRPRNRKWRKLVLRLQVCKAKWRDICTAIIFTQRPRTCFSKVPITFRARKASCQTAIALFWKGDLLSVCFQWPVSRKSRELFVPEKPVVKVKSRLCWKAGLFTCFKCKKNQQDC